MDIETLKNHIGKQGFMLEIGGAFYGDGEFALRWNGTDRTFSLYREGKRVTKPWKLALSFESPGTPLEESANTDG